jgi:hypothetical protein
MVHELRIYHCLPGRVGALQNRFRSKTLAIWKRHGIRQVGMWTVMVGESNHDFYYILAWDSLADRERKLKAFQADEEWIAVRSESERDGPIVASITNTLLEPTDYSATEVPS